MGTDCTDDLLEPLAVNIKNHEDFSAPTEQEGKTPIERNIANLDILPVSNKKFDNLFEAQNPVSGVSEINAENGTGVNRVIHILERLPEPHGRNEAFARGSVWRCDVPRVSRTVFKRRRVFVKRINSSSSSSAWNMLHRSRPDLIKGISTRSPETPSASTQGFVDGLSQSTSENSLHSSGSADSPSADRLRPRLSSTAVFSHTASVGEASGSSTPTQLTKPVFRKRENKRAEIVASVTSRLYAVKKKPDPRLEALQAVEKEDEDDDELEELKLCKRARMKLFDLSRKLAMAKKLKRTVDSDTQTEWHRSTLRVKEKCISTDQQGVVQYYSSATNTSSEKSLSNEPDTPLVLNNVIFPNAGNFVLECGPNLRVQVPSVSKSESGSQTHSTCKDQTTSPKKSRVDLNDVYSDDSLESDNDSDSPCSRPRSKQCTKNCSLSPNCHSLPTVDAPINHLDQSRVLCTSNHTNLLNRHMSAKRSIDSLLDRILPNNRRIEKSLEPIRRYNICGTNAVYEYDPNKSIPDKVIFSNVDDQVNCAISQSSTILYPEYKKDFLISHTLPPSASLGSSLEEENAKRSNEDVAEDNLSSGTSFVSTASSITSDSSSDDFIFVDKTSESSSTQPIRELYTISESTESCSKESTPLISRSPRVETADIHDEARIQASAPNDTKQSQQSCGPKKLRWSELRCSDNKQFVNFNFTPSQFPINDKGTETFSSDDSITFVFLGPNTGKTSELYEVVRRSLMAECESGSSGRSRTRLRNKGVQYDPKLFRSVSVDTAMIALSRLSRNQQRTGMTRTNSVGTFINQDSMSKIISDYSPDTPECEKHCNLNDENGRAVGTTVDSVCQYDFTMDVVSKCSVSTNTTNDIQTETDTEMKETTTQTINEIEMFDDMFPELPRRTMSLTPEPDTDLNMNFRNIDRHWKELKHLILGTNGNLFPNYFEEKETSQPKKTSKSTKCVSWSDLRDKNSEDGASDGNCDDFKSRTVRFEEPSEQKELSVLDEDSFVGTALTHPATSIVCSIPKTQRTDNDEDDGIGANSSSPLLKRRNKILTRIIVSTDECTPLSISKTNISIQTDVEKVSKLVQTGSFASSLVGPPIRRSLTPILRNEEVGENNLNMTWPRRRISRKPPTGQKSSLRPSTPIKSGSLSSRISNNSSSSPSQSALNSPLLRSPVRLMNSHTLDEEAERSIHESCRRLEMAVEQDRDRQRSFSVKMKSMFSPDRHRVVDLSIYNRNMAGNLLPKIRDVLVESAEQNVSPIDMEMRTPKNYNIDLIHKDSSFEYNTDNNSLLHSRFNNVDNSALPNRNRIGVSYNENIENVTGSCRERDDYFLGHHRSGATLPENQYCRTVESTQDEHFVFNHHLENSSSHMWDTSLRRSHARRGVQDNDTFAKKYFAGSSSMSPSPSRSLSSEVRSDQSNYWGLKNYPRDHAYVDPIITTKPPESCHQDSNIYIREVRRKSSSHDFNHLKNLKNTDRSNSIRMYGGTSCFCTCHMLTLSCGELSPSQGVRHCHSCCRPCLEGQRPYSSEPVLNLNHQFSILPSPSAYLKHLISLRRTIVAAEKRGNSS